MKKKGITVLLLAVLIVGVSLLLYPAVGNLWNSFHQSRAIVDYTSQVDRSGEEEMAQLWEDAVNYNRELAARPDRFLMTDEQRKEYESQLDLSGSGIMGYLEIPKIDCRLPVYHGTDQSVLQTGIGHLEGSSLPTGGKGTHCVLSGHRGLPSSRLLTDLDKMEIGDRFTLNVLDHIMTYEVDQILTVDPYDLSALDIDPDGDYCTLVTCTPYGINTHRLLVRGHRVENTDTAVAQPSGGIRMRHLLQAAAVPAAGTVFLFFLTGRRRKHSSRRG